MESKESYHEHQKDKELSTIQKQHDFLPTHRKVFYQVCWEMSLFILQQSLAQFIKVFLNP